MCTVDWTDTEEDNCNLSEALMYQQEKYFRVYVQRKNRVSYAPRLINRKLVFFSVNKIYIAPEFVIWKINPMKGLGTSFEIMNGRDLLGSHRIINIIKICNVRNGNSIYRCMRND